MQNLTHHLLDSSDTDKNQTSSNKFFIIDDDKTFCHVLSRSLEKQGFTTEYANEVDDIIERIAKFKPNYLSLDMKLATESGLNLISPIKDLVPECKICIVTGYASVETAVDAIKLGATHYISKPINTEQLLSAFNSQPNNYTMSNNSTVSVQEVESRHLQQSLLKHEGNISATARALGMHRRTLQRKLKKHQISNEKD